VPLHLAMDAQRERQADRQRVRSEDLLRASNIDAVALPA